MLVLIGKCQDEILAADGFEGVVDYMKSYLPVFAVENMEFVVDEVLKMDIGKDLESYEVEYRVFRDEDISLCSFEEFESQRIACLEADNTVLSRQVKELNENLSCARSTIENLEGSITTLQMNQAQLLNLIRTLRVENSELKSELEQGACKTAKTAKTAQLNTSFTEENTDSYEHIDENDITDDEAESLARDSPANELAEVGSGGTGSPSPPLIDKTEDLMVSR